MPSAVDSLGRIVRWYATNIYGQRDGGRSLPYYCDTRRVGHFAVDPAELAAGTEEALFKLLVGMALFQSRRDVDIMELQRSMATSAARALTSPGRLRVLVASNRCEHLRDPGRFDAQCSVRREIARGTASCSHRPRTPCHVKDASLAIRRMGGMGKIPTSAWLHFQREASFASLLQRVSGAHAAPTERAAAMVETVARVHLVGTKLATMFVSALSTPPLAVGLTPWYPAIDGSSLIVVDANVARVIDALRRAGSPRTYQARARWLRAAAMKIDLRTIRSDWPCHSPRLVQQAAYVFRSKSNRMAHADTCDGRRQPCAGCVPSVCPFAERMSRPPRPAGQGRNDLVDDLETARL